jgi:hypothetical protein
MFSSFQESFQESFQHLQHLHLCHQGLQPVPKEGLTAMKRGLEDIARKKCEVVKRRFDQANKVPIWEWDVGCPEVGWLVISQLLNFGR